MRQNMLRWRMGFWWPILKHFSCFRLLIRKTRLSHLNFFTVNLGSNILLLASKQCFLTSQGLVGAGNCRALNSLTHLCTLAPPIIFFYLIDFWGFPTWTLSFTMSAWKWCLVRLYLQLFIGGCMSCVCVNCVCLRIVVSNTYCFVFCSSCVLYVACLSVLSIFDFPFGIL
jgi:hypothetical protein